MLLYPLLTSFITAVAAQSIVPAVVCIPGQCLQGLSNITIGAQLSSSGAATALNLLPGEYSSSTNPALLHDMLVSSSATLKPSAGFAGANVAPLPLNLKLQPGLAIYSGQRYSGQAAFSPLPTSPLSNSSTPVTANSLSISENVWVAVSSTNNERIVLWDSVPDVAQLSLPSTFNLIDMQSVTCSPACSSSGMCSASGQCICAPNFSGASCESCAAGFFGPECKACPKGCDDCDEGISGSGQCLSPAVQPTDPKNCGCANGKCNPDGSCTCNQGWVDGGVGKCSQCAAGFFLSPTGDCTACNPGCRECSDGKAECSSCRSGFTLNPNDRTACNLSPQTDSNGVGCGPRTFSDGSACQRCDNSCEDCIGAGPGNCLTCARDLYFFNGRCVSADSNGICSGSNGQVADVLKGICDVCPSKCSSCAISGFNGSQRLNELRCTACQPGSVLSNGRCVDSCPAGTFVDPKDDFTCIPCSSSCATCAGKADFCLSCPGSLFASDGSCVSTCPSGTFTSGSSCLKCHPDCESCTGSSFTQCTACPSSRPVLSSTAGSNAGRCLSTCSKTQYFDAATQQCQACDGNCASCTGPGPNRCLSCQSSKQVVRNGQCAEAGCSNDSSVIPGLGVCLSDLVQVPSTTDGAAPLPTISGLTEPAPPAGKLKLEWWQILLMALGCAFIFVVFLWCCRRRARKQRTKRTQMFAQGKGISKNHGRWNWAAGWRLLFNRKKKNAAEDSELPIAYNHQDVSSKKGGDIKMSNLGKGKQQEDNVNLNIHLSIPDANAGSTRSKGDNRGKSRDAVDSYIDAYNYSRRSMSIRSQTPSTLPDLDGYYPSRRNKNQELPRDHLRRQATQTSRRSRDLDQESFYSELTGSARNTPEPRIPVKHDLRPIPSSSSRSSSPVRTPPTNKLKKQAVFTRQPSDETLSSVVIAPQREGMLVDLDTDSFVDGNRYDYTTNNPKSSSAPQLPLQYQYSPQQMPALPALQPQPSFQSLTDAQAYAMAVKPELNQQLTGQLNAPIFKQQQPGYTLAWVPTHMTGSSGVSETSISNSGGGVMPMPTYSSLSTAPVQSQGTGIGSNNGLYWLQSSQSAPGVILNPNVTDSSEPSRNPFRRGGL